MVTVKNADARRRLGDGRQYGEALGEIKANHRLRYEWVAESLKDTCVYDAGCGTGYGSYILAKSARKVIGLEFNHGVVSFAREHWGAQNLEFECVDLCDGIPQAAGFTNVVAFEVLEHLIQPDLFLSSIAVGSTLYGSVPNEEFSKCSVMSNPFHIRHFTYDDCFGMLELCGFDVKTWYHQGLGSITFGKQVDRTIIFTAVRTSDRSDDAFPARYQRQLLIEFLRRCNAIQDLKNGKEVKPDTAY